MKKIKLSKLDGEYIYLNYKKHKNIDPMHVILTYNGESFKMIETNNLFPFNCLEDCDLFKITQSCKNCDACIFKNNQVESYCLKKMEAYEILFLGGKNE